MKRTLPSSIKKMILALATTGLAQACMPTGFLATKNSESPKPALAMDPKTNANDRPTETGAGVPGYLVNCAEILAPADQAQIGCRVSDGSGKRLPPTAETLSRFEVQVSAVANTNIKIAKVIASNAAAFDVLFVFTGADKAQLIAAARSSRYTYSYEGVKGESVEVEVSTMSTSTSPPNTAPCTGGVMFEGVCMMSVASSCTDYCALTQQKVHPWVVERFGASATSNKQNCSDVYAQFPVSFPAIFMVTDIVTERGLGCFAQGSGQAFFDTSPTDPSTSPYLGSSRICACQ